MEIPDTTEVSIKIEQLGMIYEVEKMKVKKLDVLSGFTGG